MAEQLRDEVLHDFDKNIKSMEDACSALLLEFQPLKDGTSMVLRNLSTSIISSNLL